MGRITEQLLLHHFQEVDLLEPSQHLIDTAEQNLKRSAFSSTFPRGHAMGRKLCMGLEKFDPEPGRWGADCAPCGPAWPFLCLAALVASRGACDELALCSTCACVPRCRMQPLVTCCHSRSVPCSCAWLPHRYSCIWTQWCLLYLTDIDFLAFFKRCSKGLAPGGLFFVKENICQQVVGEAGGAAGLGTSC